MVASSSTTRSAPKSYRRQALIWLMMTLLLGIATALVWMFSQTPAIGAKIENAPISAPQVLASELEQPLSIAALHELDTDVQPISFEDTVRDLRNYPDEFKDKRFILANKGKWTVQIMNVAENEVIISYLEGREDRKKFSYFRYRDEDNQLRYMLTYGIMSSPQEAVGAAKLIDFGLPANVRVLPEEINRYVSIIDNYERPDPIKDLSTRRTRSVNLQPTKREVPVRQQSKTSAQETAVNESRDERATNTQTSNANDDIESIRQSEDTSETLSVNEERVVETDTGNTASSTPKKETNPRKGEQETQKLPVVPTPKPPVANNNSDNSTSKNNVSSNTSSKGTNTAKSNTDSIKALITENND